MQQLNHNPLPNSSTVWSKLQFFLLLFFHQELLSSLFQNTIQISSSALAISSSLMQVRPIAESQIPESLQPQCPQVKYTIEWHPIFGPSQELRVMNQEASSAPTLLKVWFFTEFLTKSQAVQGPCQEVPRDASRPVEQPVPVQCSCHKASLMPCVFAPVLTYN